MKIKNNVNSGFKGKLEDFNDLQPVGFKAPYHSEITKKSILERGFVQPFAMCEINGDLFICDGHLRKDLIYELINDGHQVPDEFSYYLIDVNNDRKKAIDILFSFNSKTNPIDIEVLTEWVNIEQVEVEVTSLNVVDLTDIEEETEVLEAQDDDFDSTPPEEPETVLGDLYEIGDHRLLCGDSTDSDQVAKLMNGQKADMVFTDPPYNMQMKGGCVGDVAKNMRKIEKDIEFISNFNPAEFLNTLPIVFDNKKMNAYIFCNKDLVPQYLNFAVENKYSFNILIWKKPNAIPLGDSHYPDVEYLLLFRKSAIWNNSLKDVNYSRCLEFGRESGLHPTMKPIELISNEMKISSNQNSLVVDFFLGSGSTMVASHQLKRKCYGMELDSKYCDVIVKRMIKLDPKLKVKRNGIDETKKWLDKL